MASAFSGFVWYRLLGGLGIGLASNLSPMYIAEVSPAETRGRFVSINQLTIVDRRGAGPGVNWAVARNMPPDSPRSRSWTPGTARSGWRWMFGAETIPASLFFILMFFVPESPRWLVKNGRASAAEKIRHVSAVAHTDSRYEVRRIRRTLAEEEIAHVRFGDLLEPRLSRLI